MLTLECRKRNALHLAQPARLVGQIIGIKQRRGVFGTLLLLRLNYLITDIVLFILCLRQNNSTDKPKAIKIKKDRPHKL